ncbi:MAG: L-histidine N(alpha)-methyltransferase [Chitinophagaceae bacterium]
MKKYDAIIIGSGQAGTPLVFNLAEKGYTIAFIEKKEVGGTCLNVGCTPTKTYVASARRMWDIAHSKDVGVDFEGSFKANMESIKNRKDKLITNSVNGIRKSLENYPNIDFIEGEAKFISNYEIEVQNNIITAPQIFINVGGRPMIPEEYNSIPYLTNESILELNELPKHLIIIGASYIGLEFGQIFKRFGSDVTIIERSNRIINREDEEQSEEILKFLKEDGIQFVLNSKSIVPSYDGNKINIRVNDNQTISGTHLLLAIGRKANTDLLQISNTDIQVDDRAYIKVNDYCQTNIDGIFAMGDCNGQGAFTHTAYNDFQIVDNYLFGNKTRKISDRITTYGLFVDPPLGRCGLTKKQALEKGINLLEGKRKMKIIARAKEKAETHGFMSILVDADSDLIVGASILGTGGDEIITSILNVMNSKMPYKLIRDSIVLHPTISELIPTTLEKLVNVKLLDEFSKDVYDSLSSTPKKLSSKYFYDKKGSELFVKIMQMKEYYVSDAEMDIFKNKTSELVNMLLMDKNKKYEIIELGAGDGSKTIHLLSNLLKQGYQFDYIPIDISKDALQGLETNLKSKLPSLHIETKHGDYFKILKELKKDNIPKIILFLGSNIGNLNDEQSAQFIYQLGEHLSKGESIVLGLDLIKAKEIVLPAYNDENGITAAFNYNLLSRINRELGANFDINNFSHKPEYDEKEGIAKSFLESKTKHEVIIEKLNKTFSFEAGEKIQTEMSRKYNDEVLKQIIQKTDFEITNKIVDSKHYFADYVLTRK